MMKYIPIFVLAFFLLGCGGGSDSTPDTSALPTALTLNCDLTVNYTPSTPPVVSMGQGVPTTTVIALHGKSATPVQEQMQTLASELNLSGYDVIMPYMPWSSLSWEGSLCDGIAYASRLIKTEMATGNSVILMGHSMGGVFLMSYAALDDTVKPAAFTMLAPGHFVPNSSVLAGLHAPSIQRAKDMVSSGEGDTIATFQTSDYNISITANNYLTFHDTAQKPSQFPEINNAIRLTSVPTLWLAGIDDPITPIAKILGFVDTAASNSLYTYKPIAGNHYSLMSNVTAELDPWYQNLK